MELLEKKATNKLDEDEEEDEEQYYNTVQERKQKSKVLKQTEHLLGLQEVSVKQVLDSKKKKGKGKKKFKRNKAEDKETKKETQGDLQDLENDEFERDQNKESSFYKKRSVF